MSTISPYGRIWVGAGFALALAFILAVLWWTTRPKVLTTADAVWFLPPAAISHTLANENVIDPDQSADLGEIAELVTMDEPQIAEEKSPAVLAAEEALANAEWELGDYLQTMQLARDAIEEAVVMVQEQRENFDYAHDRFETLMPLVETGALEPLAASQIQSSYISARASLAQAKFLLGQARREFGTEESRRRTHSRLQRQIITAKEDLKRISNAQSAGEGIVMAPGEEALPMNQSGGSPNGFIEAVFVVSSSEVNLLQPGISAIVYSAGAAERDMPISAVLEEILEVIPLSENNSLAVKLRLLPAAQPGWKSFGRLLLPCRVIIPSYAMQSRS